MRCIFNTHHFKNTKSNLNFETIYSNAFMHLKPQLVTNGKKLGKYFPHACKDKLPPVLTDYSHCTFTKNNQIVVQIIQNQLIIASTHLCGENLFLMFTLIWSQIWKWDKYTHTVPIPTCSSLIKARGLNLDSSPTQPTFNWLLTCIFLFSRLTDKRS